MRTRTVVSSAISGDRMAVGAVGLILTIALASPILLSSGALAQAISRTAVTHNAPASWTAKTPSRKFTTLYTFTGGTDGGSPAAGLVFDSSGNAYGTTEYGGANGYGTVFKLDPAGDESVLYAFTGGADGKNPVADLLLDKNGDLYGTVKWGGYCSRACGTVFKVNTQGETTLHQFKGDPDGSIPLAALVMDGAGILYGTTVDGGTSNAGTVFKLNRKGKETVLYSFQGSSDGAEPASRLVFDGAGNLYGTTYHGGSNRCSSGCGTVFKVDKKTGVHTVLYAFKGGNDGNYPNAGLVRDKSGTLFGTTSTGGSAGDGTVFSISAAGTETVLFSFTNNTLDGSYPLASLVIDKQGHLYGTTWIGGYADVGVVFKCGPKGIEKRLYSFLGGNDGGNPLADVVLDAEGNAYGTTSRYGAYGAGTVFKIASMAGGAR